jgi:hypothetical protein
MHDNDGPFIKHKHVCKKIVDSIKLSTHMFQGGMRDIGSKTCKIGRLNGTSAITRLTLFLKET